MFVANGAIKFLFSDLTSGMDVIAEIEAVTDIVLNGVSVETAGLFSLPLLIQPPNEPMTISSKTV
ncbi:MAG: hypothetical protein Kow0070_22390 [Anaerolineales bacterium]